MRYPKTGLMALLVVSGAIIAMQQDTGQLPGLLHEYPFSVVAVLAMIALIICLRNQRRK